MELQITGKNLEITDGARQYIEKKMGGLMRYLPAITEAKIEMSQEMTKSPRHRYIVQATLHVAGTLLRGEERGPDFYAATDKVKDVLLRQIKRYKDRLYDKGRGASPARTTTPEGEEGTPETRQVVRVKRFLLHPMPVEEAIDQMELLDHTFFLFFNSTTQKINLVYRRNDSNYGLIEPELD